MFYWFILIKYVIIFYKRGIHTYKYLPSQECKTVLCPYTDKKSTLYSGNTFQNNIEFSNTQQ